jgi:hypothetical protein
MALKDDRLTGTPGAAGPRPSRRQLYPIVAVAAGLLLVGALVVGLVVGRPGTRSQPGQQTPPGPPPAPTGIVTVTDHAGAAGFVLAFHDAATGRVTHTAAATAAGVTGPGMRQRFAADLTWFAWTTGDALHVARLNPTGYTEAASWTPDQDATWEDALVNPVTGRIWFRETRTATGNGGTVARSMRIVSIDPNVAGDKPRAEQVEELPKAFDDAGTPTHKQAVPLVDDAKLSAELAITDRQLLGATVTQNGAVQYECPAALAPDTLICYAPPLSQVRFGTPHGSVAELRLDRTTRRASLRPLLSNLGPAAVQGLLVSPDRTQLRLWTERGWLSTGLPNPGSPQPAEMAQPADAPLAWR